MSTTRTRRLARHITRAIGVGACGVALLGAPALAQQPTAAADTKAATPATPSADVTALMGRANTAYNAERYDEAIGLYVQALQRAPERGEAYRNMARAYFWQANYAAAVAHYDIYLVSFATDGDRETIQRERRLAATRTTTPWQLPAPQKAALSKLEALLEPGQPAYSKTGASAWQAHQTLLKSGYAHPNLLKLRGRLAAALLKEHDARMALKPEQLTPSLTVEGWQEQRERLKLARSLTADAALVGALDRRDVLDRAAIELLLGRHLEAAKLAEVAAKQNPELTFIPWLRISALIHANRTNEALETLDLLEPRIAQEAPQWRDRAQVIRAILLHQTGSHKRAADLYLETLTQR